MRRLWREQGDTLAAQHGSENDPRPVSEYIGKAIAILRAGPPEAIIVAMTGKQFHD